MALAVVTVAAAGWAAADSVEREVEGSEAVAMAEEDSAAEAAAAGLEAEGSEAVAMVEEDWAAVVGLEAALEAAVGWGRRGGIKLYSTESGRCRRGRCWQAGCVGRRTGSVLSEWSHQALRTHRVCSPVQLAIVAGRVPLSLLLLR